MARTKVIKEMGGGGSKSLAKKRAKEFQVSSDDEADDDEEKLLYMHRSLYKIFSGNLVKIEPPPTLAQHRCRC